MVMRFTMTEHPIECHQINMKSNFHGWNQRNPIVIYDHIYNIYIYRYIYLFIYIYYLFYLNGHDSQDKPTTIPIPWLTRAPSAHVSFKPRGTRYMARCARGPAQAPAFRVGVWVGDDGTNPIYIYVCYSHLYRLEYHHIYIYIYIYIHRTWWYSIQQKVIIWYNML